MERARREETASTAAQNNAPNVFAFTPEQLSTLHNPKNLRAFLDFGGLLGLEKGLLTDRRNGLDTGEAVVRAANMVEDAKGPSPVASSKDGLLATRITTRASKTLHLGRPSTDVFAERKHVFSDNMLPTRKTPGFFHLVWATYNDPVLFLLTAAAVVSLAIGLYQSFGTVHTKSNPGVEWVEGVAILIAIFVIVLVGSVNDWEKQRQFQKLNRKQLERDVKVIRSGTTRLLPISQVLVGDVVDLEPGDIIPSDGILIDGYNITCNESTATGESDPVYKTPADEAYRPPTAPADAQDLADSRLDPFILSGTEVLEGIGTYIVTATGLNSTYGKILSSLREDSEPTPLQKRLVVVAKYIARTGALWAGLLFVALFIKFLATLPHSTLTPPEKGQVFVDIVIISLTVLVIAVPEGLPLAVTLSLAFATIKMLKDHNLVRRLKACETMGNATNICSDKTGTLTENKMVVVAGALLPIYQFHDDPTIGVSANNLVKEKSRSEISSSTPVTQKSPSVETSSGEVWREKTPSELVTSMAPDFKSLLVQSISLNSTAFEAQDGRSWVGSPTESALLDFARDHLGMGPVALERSNAKITQLIPFNAKRQCMVTVVQLLGQDDTYRVFVKGASEVLLAKCSMVLQDPMAGCFYTNMTTEVRRALSEIIQDYGNRSLRTLSLAFKDVVSPRTGMDKTDFTLDYLLADLVFAGVVGIKDPLRAGVADAVTRCQRAGVTVRMVTGDNVQTATAIAQQCGILSDNAEDVVMKGVQFRSLSQEQLDQVIPNLKVLARSSPEDKRRLVVRLKELGEIVAVTGDGTNDAPALSAADISFSMGGMSGTEIAREASSIVLMTDDFACIVSAIMWGRVTHDAIKRFLQFQITITVTSVGLTFISAIANSTEHSVLTAVQLMWVNLFQDTLAALALATDAPHPRVLDRKPEARDAPLVTVAMWKNIISQSAYQLIVTIVLYFAGARILNAQTELEYEQLQTLVFNTYVWLQIFNLYNDRQHDNTLNIFEGMFRNVLFLAVSVIMIGGQLIIIFVGGDAFSVTPLNGYQWAISIVLGALSLPLGVLVRLLPDKPFERAAEDVQRWWAMVWPWGGRRNDSSSGDTPSDAEEPLPTHESASPT